MTLRAVQSKSETLETLLPQGVQSFNGEVSCGTNTDPILFREPNSNKKYKIAGNLNKNLSKGVKTWEEIRKC